MNIVVLDLEWNGAYSRRLHGYINEIIEFGAVKLDKKMNITDRFSCFVKPQVGKKISSIISDLTNITDFTDKSPSVMQYYNRDGTIRWYLGPDGIVQLEQAAVIWRHLYVATMNEPRTTATAGMEYEFYRCVVPEGMQLEDAWADKNNLAVETPSVNGLPFTPGTYYALEARRLYYIAKTTLPSGVTSAYWGWVWVRTKYKVVAEGENSYVTSSEIQWIENEAPEGGVIDR